MWLQEALLWVPWKNVYHLRILHEINWYDRFISRKKLQHHMIKGCLGDPWIFTCFIVRCTSLLLTTFFKTSIPNILKLSSEWSNQKIYQRNQTQEKDVNILWLKFSPTIFQLRMKLPDFASSSWENSDNKASIKAAETSMSSVEVEQPTGRIDFQTSIDHSDYMKWWHGLG